MKVFPWAEEGAQPGKPGRRSMCGEINTGLVKQNFSWSEFDFGLQLVFFVDCSVMAVDA